MPTYDYECTSCGRFEAVRSIDDRNLPATCGECGKGAQRVMVAAPRLAMMPSDQRFAFYTNERASYEPKHSSSYRHPPGCSCCKPSSTKKETDTSSGRDVINAAPIKSFANKRPWMISH
jgi:putative FmdB family regulatory protein